MYVSDFWTNNIWITRLVWLEKSKSGESLLLRRSSSTRLDRVLLCTVYISPWQSIQGWNALWVWRDFSNSEVSDMWLGPWFWVAIDFWLEFIHRNFYPPECRPFQPRLPPQDRMVMSQIPIPRALVRSFAIFQCPSLTSFDHLPSEERGQKIRERSQISCQSRQKCCCCCCRRKKG